MQNPAVWVNKTVTVEGHLTANPPAYTSLPWIYYWNYVLNSSSGEIGIHWNNATNFYDNEEVLVYGVVSELSPFGPNGPVHAYYIEAERVVPF
jgi:hypothetical protein